MTLEEMCNAAARYSDRYDEFERSDDGDAYYGEEAYEDDALNYFNVFHDAINEAYREVSRLFAMPDTYTKVKVNKKKQIELLNVVPEVFGVKELLNADQTEAVKYTFNTKYALDVNASPGDTLTLYYHYIPDPLNGLPDSPIFSEAQVDPMIYISLAVARIWYSEKKFDYGNQWMSQYYSMLRNVRSNLKGLGNRRIPRGIFR